jgi:hypothetical protein
VRSTHRKRSSVRKESREIVAPPTQIRQHLNKEVERIRGYADLTEKAKAEYQEAVEAEERKVQERAERAEKALFQPSYPYGASEVEMAQLRALRRSAYDGVYDRTAPLFEPADPEGLRNAREELERLLERAERTGDLELAAAVYHVATERGERSVADAYLETRPKERRRWEEYVTAQTEAQSLGRLFERAFTEKLSPRVER